MSVRNILGSLQAVGGLLIKRGTAMGPLVPSLLLSPGFVFSAWLFRATAVFSGVPVLSVIFVVAALWIVLDYHRHYARFAKQDPDRLQSEEYRYETARMQMIAAKELQRPMLAEDLSLTAAVSNPTAHGAADEEVPVSASVDDKADS